MSDEPTEEPQEYPGLIHIEFGLQPFREEQSCPKCQYRGLHVSYHSSLVLNTGQGQYPCGSWYRSGFLTGDIGEHLCFRCTRCHYGFPTQTADTYQAPPEEQYLETEGET